MGISETIKAISHPVRRQILEQLRLGPKTAGDIAARFDLSQATISHHLSQLKKVGLICEEKKKNFIYYQLDTTVFEELLIWIKALGGQNDEKKQ